MAKKQKNTDTGLITENRQGYSGPDEAVITRLIEQTKWRTRQDIDTWRSAILAAENIINPYRVPLYTLYEEILLDSHIQGIIGQRRDALLAEPFKIVDSNGVKSDVLTDMFDDEWFYTYMSLVHDSVYWGHTLIQLWDPIPDEGYGQIIEVPRRHVMPEFGIVSRVQGDTSAVESNYRQAPYVDWVVEAMPQGPRGHGLFKIAAPDFIIKKNAKLNWSQYTEIFGMPIRVGKTRSTKQTDVNRMSDVLKRMGAAGYGVFQEGEGIEFIESTKGDAYNVYDKLIERCNSELSKLFIRQTMTVEDGSSRSQGEVHERTMEVLKEFDKRMIRLSVKKQLAKRMVGHGLLPTGYKFLWEATVDLDALFKKVIGLFAEFEVDEEWVKTTFGIPVTKKLLPAGEVPDDDKDTDEEEDDDPKDPKDKGKRPKPTGTPKKKSLSLTVHNLYQSRCSVCGGKHIKLSGDKEKPLPVDYSGLAKTIWESQDDKGAIDGPTALSTAKVLFEGVKDGYGTSFKKTGAPGIIAKLQTNLYNFSAAKTYAQMNEMRDLLYKDGTKQSFDDYKAGVKQLGIDYNETHLRTEWNTTNSSAQLADRWGDYVQDADLYPNLKYTTVGDSRVREAHRILDGIILAINDPWWRKYYPPNDYNCRCSAEQMGPSAKLDDSAAVGKLAKSKANVPVLFQNNVGATGIVFRDMHPYFENAKGQLKNLNYKSYGMPSVEEVKGTGKSKPDMDEAAFSKWATELLDGNDETHLPDYDQVAVRIDSDALNHVTKRGNQDGQHWQVSANLETLLSKPDESFIYVKQGTTSKSFLRYFTDRTLIAIAELDEKDGWFLKTYYQWDGDVKANDIRKGVLANRTVKK